MSTEETTIFTSKLEEAQDKLSFLLGEKTLLQFRTDIGAIFDELNEEQDATEYKKRKLVRIGRSGLDETKQRYLTIEKGLNLMDISDAFLSLALFIGLKELSAVLGFPTLPSYLVAFLLSAVLYFLNTGLVFGKALIDRIAFPKEQIHTRLPPNELRFRAGWNKGVLQSNMSLIGMVLFGLFTSPQSAGYKLGLRFIEAYERRKWS